MPIRTINNFEVLGRMVMDPVYREATDKSQSRAWFKFAVGLEGAKKDTKPFYFNVIAWDRNANNIVRWCGKGKELLLRGHLENCFIEQKDGTTREETSLVVERVIFGDTSQKQQSSESSPVYQEQQEVPKTSDPVHYDFPEFTESGSFVIPNQTKKTTAPPPQKEAPVLEKGTIEALRGLGLTGENLLELVKDRTKAELEKRSKARF